MTETGELYRRFHEALDNPARLGRNLWLDGRSLAYMIEQDTVAMRSRIESKHWARQNPILDQGQVGSCTGNAGAGALGTDSKYAPGDPHLDESFALQLYCDATIADAYPGVYPPDDTGSSGLAVCKVLKTRGTIHGYRWARTAYGLARLLQDGPVMMGMPWHERFFEPDPDGFIDDGGWERTPVVGGHEVCIVGIDLDQNMGMSVMTVANSWSSSWGVDGYFRMRVGTYEMLDDVDLKQLVVA